MKRRGKYAWGLSYNELVTKLLVLHYVTLKIELSRRRTVQKVVNVSLHFRICI